tara:strand:+ start:481 stop:852 length:372 start_codon:yes stop_codon:yes gene_type:complete
LAGDTARTRTPSVQRIDEIDSQVYNDIKTNNDSLNNLDLKDEDQTSKRMSVPFGLCGLNYLDVEAILATKAIDSRVVDLYMDCIAKYVNSIRRPVAVSGGNGKIAEPPHTGYRGYRTSEGSGC